MPEMQSPFFLPSCFLPGLWVILPLYLTGLPGEKPLVPTEHKPGSLACQVSAFTADFQILVCMFHWNIWRVPVVFQTEETPAPRQRVARGGESAESPGKPASVLSLPAQHLGHRFPYSGVHVPLEHPPDSSKIPDCGCSDPLAVSPPKRGRTRIPRKTSCVLWDQPDLQPDRRLPYPGVHVPLEHLVPGRCDPRLRHPGIATCWQTS